MRLFIHCALVLTMLVSAGVASLPVTAQESTATTVSPTPPSDIRAFEIYPKGKMLGDFFAPEIKAGKTAELVVVLANTGNVEFQGRTYATNAHTAVNGGFEVAE